jgi:hypothetical protein
MAFYGIPSAGLAVTAAAGSDTLSLYNNSTAVLSSTTVMGLEGNDVISLAAQGYTATASSYYSGIANSGSGAISLQLIGSSTYSTSESYSGVTTWSGSLIVSGVLTSERAGRSIDASKLYGNQGNDTIALGDSFTTLASTTLGGGAGNDFIGTYTNVNNVWTGTINPTAATITALFAEGGGGNDVIRFELSGATLTSSTFQGIQGNDTIRLIGTAGTTVNNTQLLGGGGNDDISASISASTGLTLAGGGGNDSLALSADGTLVQAYIAGDAINSISTYDGSDLISADASLSASTIAGMGGNDSIYLSGTDGGNNLLAGNTGNDLIDVGNTKLNDSTVQGGAGNDTIDLDTLSSSYVFGGGGNDNIVVTGADIGSGVLFSATTIYGGDGADHIGSGATLSGGATVGTTFGYSAYSDSTLSAMDTIAVGGSAASGSYVFHFAPGGITAATFSSTNVTGAAGVATFTSTFDTDVTSRAAAINSAETETGAAVLFRDGSNDNYLFVQGGTTDLLVQVGTAGTASNGTLTVNASKTITLNLA